MSPPCTSLVRVHNHINETLFNTPDDYAPRFTLKANGRAEAPTLMPGFYAAMHLNMKDWKPLLKMSNINHGLLLPIMIYCIDKKGHRVLDSRSGPDTAHFIEHEAYKDIARVVPALNELYKTTRHATSE